MKHNIKFAWVAPTATIRGAMEKMTDAHMGVLAILNEDKTLFGIVVDGDIRRALIQGVSIDDPVSDVANQTPVISTVSCTNAELADVMKTNNKMCIPITDENKKFICFKYYEEVTSVKKIVNKAMILAGGFGKRLMPYTATIPKPMLRVGGKPLIEKIIDGLIAEGVNDITLLLHYMPEIFTEYFRDKPYYGDVLKFIVEIEPKGTAGGLNFLANKISEPFLVLNGDNIILAEWSEIINEHKYSGNLITIGASEYSTAVPYGVLEIEGDQVTGITEKPIKSWLTVCSAYCISPQVLKYIPSTGNFDMPDLINCVLKDNGKIGYFRVREYQRIEDLVPSHKVIWDEQKTI